jgi:hypothetical protein
MSGAGNASSIASNCSQDKNSFCRHRPSVFSPRPALSAFTRVHSPSKTGVNALEAGEGRAAPHPGHELILRAA